MAPPGLAIWAAVLRPPAAVGGSGGPALEAGAEPEGVLVNL